MTLSEVDAICRSSIVCIQATVEFFYLWPFFFPRDDERKWNSRVGIGALAMVVACDGDTRGGDLRGRRVVMEYGIRKCHPSATRSLYAGEQGEFFRVKNWLEEKDWDAPKLGRLGYMRVQRDGSRAHASAMWSDRGCIHLAGKINLFLFNLSGMVHGTYMQLSIPRM